MDNKQFWIDAVERVVRTALVCYYGLWQAQGASWDHITDPVTLKATATAAFASGVLALIGGRVGDPTSASIFPKATSPDTNVVPIPQQVFVGPDRVHLDELPVDAPVPARETASPTLAPVSATVTVSYPSALPVEPLPTPAETPAPEAEPTA